jgi:NTP pyrophosphatase (non-canonical NTP hydrolase)
MIQDGNLIQQLRDCLEEFTIDIHHNAVSKGFWPTNPDGSCARNDGEAIALMHSELSEMLEAIRHGNPPSDHIPEFTGAEEEAADLVIRLLDWCGARNIRLADAILAKMAFNENRPHKHGKTC